MTARKTAAKAQTTRKPAENKDLTQEKRRMRTILRRLHKEYPDSQCSLHFKKPLQLVLATILSAQCTDERVNMVTPGLFKKYPTARRLADAEIPEVEEIIRSTGFYRNKAKSLNGAAKAILDRHAGQVPDTLEALVKLPGVGRKTANVVLGEIWNRPAGVVVDTHVSRIALKLGFTDTKDAVKAEVQLNEVLPRTDWRDFTHLVIDHGRKTCRARTPRCDACTLYRWCETRA